MKVWAGSLLGGPLRENVVQASLLLPRAPWLADTSLQALLFTCLPPSVSS